MWSVGVLAFELLIGRPAFREPTAAKTTESIQYSDLECPVELSSGAKSFIRAALSKVREGHERAVHCTAILLPPSTWMHRAVHG